MILLMVGGDTTHKLDEGDWSENECVRHWGEGKKKKELHLLQHVTLHQQLEVSPVPGIHHSRELHIHPVKVFAWDI